VKVLGLDTSTLTAGIAIVEARDGAPLVVLTEARHDSSGRSTDLLVTIDDACKRAGVAPAELDAIAVGAGPGSFTGLRIGMATAKGIAFAAQRPLWAVSSLAALADDACQLAPDATIAAVLDARRAEVFAGVFRAGALLAPESVHSPDELAAWVIDVAAGTTVRFAGDALAAYPDALAPLADRWLPIATPSGVAVARLALAGPREDVVVHGTPSYIRASEAEIKYPDGVPGALRRT
jgi:tRNA threonylcarbamoyladenosine biosynthesis protein TsaB